jgi:hypothetical protein
MTYLIMRCDELGDQFECDANRKPITLTDDWKKWYETNNPNYCFEVYEFSKDHFTRIKDYDDPMEEGMCLAYYPNDDETPMALKKYPNLDRYSEVPKDILKRALKSKEYKNYLERSGYISWREKRTLYCWTEYADNIIYNCF